MSDGSGTSMSSSSKEAIVDGERKSLMPALLTNEKSKNRTFESFRASYAGNKSNSPLKYGTQSPFIVPVPSKCPRVPSVQHLEATSLGHVTPCDRGHHRCRPFRISVRFIAPLPRPQSERLRSPLRTRFPLRSFHLVRRRYGVVRVTSCKSDIQGGIELCC